MHAKMCIVRKLYSLLQPHPVLCRPTHPGTPSPHRPLEGLSLKGAAAPATRSVKSATARPPSHTPPQHREGAWRQLTPLSREGARRHHTPRPREGTRRQPTPRSREGTRRQPTPRPREGTRRQPTPRPREGARRQPTPRLREGARGTRARVGPEGSGTRFPQFRVRIGDAWEQSCAQP